ncbi:MAG: ribose-phosphate pyrophosphokinase [Gammaproteobacteria bacterium]|nr:ribose-phosphate pyrophosphokinase [Gammaproteobacteria bacterium]
MDNSAPIVFALDTSRSFGDDVARQLGISLSACEEREFEDGEHKSRPLVNVRNKNVYVIQSLYGDPRQSVNDKLVRLLFFIGALKDASAARVTAVVPHLAYARKDAKTQTRDPVTTRYVAQLFEAAGTDRVVTMDVHNLAAFQNAFRCRTDHLEATKLFVAHFASLLKAEPQITVVSPDIGGMKRAERFRQALGRALNREPNVAFMEKARAKGVMRAGRLIGDVAGTAIIIDDLISTGGTLRHAAAACRESGATKVYAAATHGVFVGSANNLLSGTTLNGVVVTDTIPPFRLDPGLARDKLTTLSAAPLFAEAIRCIHNGGSLVKLLEI